MDQTCVVLTVQAGGGGVVAHFGPLIPLSINHHLNATAYLIWVAGHVHPFTATVTQHDNEQFDKAKVVFKLLIQQVL